MNGIMGKAMVDGYQQKSDQGVAACLKHFAGYGAVNAGREYNDVEISQRTFLEQYVKPFLYGIKGKACYGYDRLSCDRPKTDQWK